VSALVIVCFRGVLPPTEAVTLPGGTFLVSVSALGSLAVPASLEADGARFVPGSTNGWVIAGLLVSDSTGLSIGLSTGFSVVDWYAFALAMPDAPVFAVAPFRFD
jgi:hypothetical protein